MLFLSGHAVCADAQVVKHHHKSKRSVERVFVPRYNVLTTHFGAGYIAGYAGVSGVLEYERHIDRGGLFSVTIAGGAYNSGTVASGAFRDGTIRTTQYGSFVAPGLRFHPMNNRQQLDIAFGVSMPVGSSVCTDRYRVNNYIIDPVSSRSPLGAVQGQAHANLRTVRGFVFGLFVNGGYFYSIAGHTLSKEANSNAFLVFGFKMGGQW